MLEKKESGQTAKKKKEEETEIGSSTVGAQKEPGTEESLKQEKETGTKGGCSMKKWWEVNIKEKNQKKEAAGENKIKNRDVCLLK